MDFKVAVNSKLEREIRVIAQLEANKHSTKQTVYKGKPNLANAIRLLLWLGVETYKAHPKFNSDKYDVAEYMVDHDGLSPAQVKQSEIDSILSVFDSIDKHG